MPGTLTIVAKIQALPGFETEVERALREVIKPTLAETGCLQYDLHRDLQTPGLFLYFENWATAKDWQSHMQSSHLAEMEKNTAGKTDDVVIFQMEKIDP